MDIIYTHCSTLINIADIKLKMSRSYCSYDEEWQRRKSVLIRSLFHDIPILSPVEEESNDSVQDYQAPSPQPFPSPPRPYSPLPPLIIERVPITNKHDEPEEYYTKLHKKMIKIYVKLFIENRNFSSITSSERSLTGSVNDDNPARSDDSESVENIDLRFLESISPGNGDFDSIIEDRKARESSASTRSNGYGADFESMDTAIIDVVNHTTSTEDAVNITEIDESDPESFESDERRNKDSDNCSSSEHIKRTDNQVSDEGLTFTIHDQEMTEIEVAKEIEVELGYEDEELSNESIEEHEIAEETNETGDSDTVRIDVLKTRDQSRHSTINDREMAEIGMSRDIEVELDYEDEELSNENIDEHENTEETNETGNSETVRIDVLKTGDESRPSIIKDQAITDSKDSNELEYEQQTETKIETDLGSHHSGTKLKGGEKTSSEGGNGDVETSSTSVDSDYRQITTIALVHYDGSKDFEDRESRVYEDSVKSVILPIRFRRVAGRSLDDGVKVLAELEDTDDPNTGSTFNPEEGEEDLDEVRTLPVAIGEDILAMETSTPEATEKEFEESRTPRLDSSEEDITMRTHPPETDKDQNEEEYDVEMESPHSIEQMRTPRPDISRGTMSVIHQSESESTNERITLPQEATMMTSSSKDGVEQDISNLQSSNDMNGILTAILNRSGSKNGTPVSAKKRKLADKSVQAAPTMRVTWDEMRTNFFVGTPKIFRLCACTDHICL
ncbi:hypothetical protein PYW08_012849 [Mythimna loreyi]|uniref:Uncharacterized protein n=1 Tax=Mythimna loreyi TaxID=667449 RepID=A0ACC2Q6D3_9NEOP|nr:hypothetical protein PYW08_012849 [Mythimna loreyi]